MPTATKQSEILTGRGRSLRRIGFAASGFFAISMFGGCDAFRSNSLWSKHMADNQHEAAQQRWNDVRGNVKLQIVEQHMKAGRLEDAETALVQVLAMSPKNANAFKLATRLHLERGQLSKARETINTAAALLENDAETAYLAGIVAQRYGEFDKALEHYLKADALASNVAEYVMAAAEMWVAKGEPERALSLIDTRLRDFDGSGPMRMLAAQLCRRLEMKERALTHSREVLRMCDDERAHVEAALILSWAEAYDDAIDVLQPLVDKRHEQSVKKSRTSADDPSGISEIITPTVVHELARAYAATGQWKRSARVLKHLMARDESDITAWSLYARAALMLGDLKAADQAISEYNRRNPPTAETLLLKAYISYKRGDYASTRKAAEDAFQLDDQLKPALWLSGKAAQASGHFNEAEDAFTRALAIGPDSAATRAMLAALRKPVAPGGAKVAANRPVTLGNGQMRTSSKKPSPAAASTATTTYDTTAKLHVPESMAELYEGLEP